MDWFHLARVVIAVGAILVALWLPLSVALCAWTKIPAAEWFSAWVSGMILLALAATVIAGCFAVVGWALG